MKNTQNYSEIDLQFDLLELNEGKINSKFFIPLSTNQHLNWHKIFTELPNFLFAPLTNDTKNVIKFFYSTKISKEEVFHVENTTLSIFFIHNFANLKFFQEDLKYLIDHNFILSLYENNNQKEQEKIYDIVGDSVLYSIKNTHEHFEKLDIIHALQSTISNLLIFKYGQWKVPLLPPINEIPNNGGYKLLKNIIEKDNEIIDLLKITLTEMKTATNDKLLELIQKLEYNIIQNNTKNIDNKIIGKIKI